MNRNTHKSASASSKLRMSTSQLEIPFDAQPVKEYKEKSHDVAPSISNSTPYALMTVVLFIITILFLDNSIGF